MSIYVAPGATFEASAANFDFGLAGTIGVRITDGQGATITARTTSGVAEYPANSGIYTATLTAPVISGQYQVIWDDGGSPAGWASEELIITPTPIPVVGTVVGARTGMADLIWRVRSMTNAGTAEYQVGTVNYWSDAHVQEVLDRHRMDLVRHRLSPEQTYTGGGSVEYRIHRSAYGHLESGTALTIQDSVGDTRGTATYGADYQGGVFEFAADQAGTALYLTARSYDVHAAAGELLEEWASAEARRFDFAADGQSFARSQRAKALREQASAMRKRARVRRKRLRTDS